MDLSTTTQARSDQQNYDDYAGGIVRTVTVAEVKKGSSEQPVEIHLVEFPGKPFKPAKTVRRVLVAAWGADSSVYVGRRMTLFGDPTVKWAGQAVGGIRVSHLSHIDKPIKVMLSESKGKRVPVTVQPLPDEPQVDPVQALGVALERSGLDRSEWLPFCSRATGRDVQQPGDLSPDEISQVIASLEAGVQS